MIAGDELFADVIYPQPESFVALHDKAHLAVDYELADVFFFHVHKLFGLFGEMRHGWSPDACRIMAA